MARSITALFCFAAAMIFTPIGHAQVGIASVYGVSGEKTANGERLSAGALTAAHRSLPLGSRAVVTNKVNGRSVVVRINDRGPFVRGRVIDLTLAAAHALGFSGLTRVQVTALTKPTAAVATPRRSAEKTPIAKASTCLECPAKLGDGVMSRMSASDQ
jgi:rare lipoprotein A